MSFTDLPLWRPWSRLDEGDAPPRLFTAILAGAGLGLLWGAAARLWMRLLSTDPEFSVGGTAFILASGIVVGACAGLAYGARRRRWGRRALLLARFLVVASFLPLIPSPGAVGMALPVLLATLGVARKRWPLVLRVILLLPPLAIVVAGSWMATRELPWSRVVLAVPIYVGLLYPLFVAMRTALEPLPRAAAAPATVSA